MEVDLMQELTNLQTHLEQHVDRKMSVMEEGNRKNQKALDKLLKAKDHSFDTNEGFGEALQKSYEKNYDAVQRLIHDKVGRVSMEIDQKAMTTIATSGIGGTAHVITDTRGAIYDLGTRQHVRDFISLGTMTGSRVSYLVESPMVGAPAPVAEGALKPEVEIRLSEAVAENQFIAAWTNLSTKVFDDVPNLPGFLNQRLTEALLVAEDAQIINGSGVSPNLRGIGTAGSFTVATAGAATDDMLQLISGIAQLAGMNRSATGILLSIDDYFRLVGLQTENAGLKVVTINAQGNLSVLGVPVGWNLTVPAGTYYVIDRSGVAMLFREAARIEIFFADSDNARRNSVTIRIEQRVALAYGGSNFIIKGAF